MFKDFEDFWKNSGILDTDSYRCISKTYEFSNENVPQAFESFGRNCYTFGATQGFELGRQHEHEEMGRTFLVFLDTLKMATDINALKQMIETIESIYKDNIKPL